MGTDEGRDDAADGIAGFERIGEMDSKSLLKPHVPLLVVTESETTGPNVMTAAWWMLAGYDPFRYLLSVDHGTDTYEILEEHPEFVMGVPTVEQLDAVTRCGTTSGREVDKVETLDLDLVEAAEVDVPLLADALGNVECRVEESFEFGNITYYFGEVAAAHVGRGGLDGRILSPAAGPLAYMGSDRDEDGAKYRYYLEYGDLARAADEALLGTGSTDGESG